MNTNGVRAAIYLRISRDDQTTENQRLVLARVAEHLMLTVIAAVGTAEREAMLDYQHPGHRQGQAGEAYKGRMQICGDRLPASSPIE
jgi:hypothetical protein